MRLTRSGYKGRSGEIVGVVNELIRGTKTTNGLMSHRLFIKSTKSVVSMLGMPKARIKMRRFFSPVADEWKVNRWVVLAALLYVSDRIYSDDSGKPFFITGDLYGNEPEEGNVMNYLDLIASVFTSRPYEFFGGANGHIFHLMKIVEYDLRYRFAGGDSIEGIELVRTGHVLVGDEPKSNYKREVDIVLIDDKEKEKWIELKSIDGNFSETSFAVGNTDSGSGLYRQFFHDMRLNKEFLPNDSDRVALITGSSSLSGNINHMVYVQKFKKKPGRLGVSPNTDDIRKLRGWLCEKNKKSSSFYKDNTRFKSSKTFFEECSTKSTPRVVLSDVSQLVKELLVSYQDQIGIDEFLLEIVKGSE